jgi:hypothetical protein
MLKQNTPLQPFLSSRSRENVSTERLLPSQQRRLFSQAIATLCDIELDTDGSNRRTIGLLPLPRNRQEHEIVASGGVKLQQLLLSIEARRISCCIRVFSDNSKSRSSILVYRGRLAGCVYGRRDLSRQLYGKPAFEQIMTEMLSPHNIIDAYPLNDEIVLASASLFHGGLNDVFGGAAAIKVYPNCARMMMVNKRTGCLVVNSGTEAAVCVTYMFEGRIVGVYSFTEGWLTKTQAAALDCIECNTCTGMSMSMLPVETDVAEVLTESLTGLDCAINKG